MLPSFLCIGAQKSGTTTLYGLLKQHPNIYLPPTKELHYFTLNYSEGIDWYKNHFINCASHQVCGEITPYYLFHPFAALRASQVIPNARILILLRDPVERALSQYYHSCRLKFETLDIKSAFEVEQIRLYKAEQILFHNAGRHSSHQEHSYLSRSIYQPQVNSWLRYYSKDNIMLIHSQQLFNSPIKTMALIFSFLGLPKFSDFDGLPHLNSGEGEGDAVESSFKQLLSIQLDETYKWMSMHNLNYPLD